MNNLVIPQVSAVGACIVAVCILVSTLKKLVPKWAVVWLPLVFALPLGFAVAFAEAGWTLILIQTTIIKTFSICAGSMASYDLVTKTVKEWKRSLTDKEAEHDKD